MCGFIREKANAANKRPCPCHCVLPVLILLAVLAVAATPSASRAEAPPLESWAGLFSFIPPPVDASGVCKGEIGALPEFRAGCGGGLVRVSVPFAPGALPAGMAIVVHAGDLRIPAQLRALTLHPGSPQSIRRAIITFPFTALDGGSGPVFRPALAGRAPIENPPQVSAEEETWRFTFNDVEYAVSSDRVAWTSATAGKGSAGLIAPARTTPEPCRFEVIESGPYFLWVRLLAGDAIWPRIIELRVNSLGGAWISAQLQRMEKGDAFAPDLGWNIDAPSDVALAYPMMEAEKRGGVEAVEEQGRTRARFLRCRADENVPFQESAWRSAVFTVAASGAAAHTLDLTEPCGLFNPEAFINAYGFPPLPDLDGFHEIRSYTHDAIRKAMCVGDDFGNITGFNRGSEHGGPFGMNRLNHAAAVFEEAWRADAGPLAGVMTRWCLNMHDLSIWWKPGKDFGGTRYNNAVAAGQKEHDGDRNFMWRTNGASDFCTKGYDSFLYAYEETGDPRFTTALRHQAGYAASHVHADKGECRNIGDAADFMRLHRLTGVPRFKDEAMRLFHELRGKTGDDNLFSQGGQPLHPDETFIDDDAHGYEHPFRKPYILGYALAGLPALLELEPDEPRLRDIVRAVADFQAAAQDPTGGWRYPHPRSSFVIIDQGMEHSAQIARAARVLEKRGEPVENLLDAVERTLQGRIVGFLRTGTILSGLSGWEKASGALQDGRTTYDLYKRPGDRDTSRDYAEGGVGIGGASPEGLAYFGEVLDFYLAHRPAGRLLNANAELTRVLDRAPDSKPWPLAAAEAWKPYEAIKGDLPAFAGGVVDSMTFPKAWRSPGSNPDGTGHPTFDEWRKSARQTLTDALLPRPGRASALASAPELLATEDRGTHEARKIAFPISGRSRVTAYLLVPKGPGPFPAILALHDHGAHFSIGKEKVVKPFGVGPAVMEDARKWVEECYEGRWIGDGLAARGYVVLATDALFWGERGRAEGVGYEAQQAFAANLFQLGMSWAGVIAWDDLASAEFLQSRPEVIPSRIGAIGLSMGASRTWHLAALTDIIKAGAAVCWMGDTRTLMRPGNNQTRGQSAFSMLHPGLRNALDYPDVASIAAPKPMLFLNGTGDPLFPVEGVEACYARMREVWTDACGGDEELARRRLVTKLHPVPHVFNAAMQEEAFAFLDRWLKP